ncbi:MAG: N-acetyltransferase [Erysipelotrichaceae bacterium]|jgi:predicted GNAT family acetyltransferase|nr:N-acetyltransferase [Erysipelotrichaceae bacterium]
MIDIHFEKDQQRAAAYDHGKQVGVCEIQIVDKEWTIMHTKVDPAYGGQGIGKALVQCVYDQGKKEDANIILVCSYAKNLYNKGRAS